MTLTTKQTAYLRSLSQSLRPQLMIGHEGYSDRTLGALEDLFRGRELVKVRMLKTAEDDPKEIARATAEAAGASLVGVVGRTFVVYRPNPELKDRIELPENRPPTGGRSSGRASQR